jgi:hypothetical protein
LNPHTPDARKHACSNECLRMHPCLRDALSLSIDTTPTQRKHMTHVDALACILKNKSSDTKRQASLQQAVASLENDLTTLRETEKNRERQRERERISAQKEVAQANAQAKAAAEKWERERQAEVEDRENERRAAAAAAASAAAEHEKKIAVVEAFAEAELQVPHIVSTCTCMHARMNIHVNACMRATHIESEAGL